MKIKCTNCGYAEETDKDFFVKLIGGAMPVGGFWAWTTYLFAGTGFAMAIVIAIIGGGVAMLIFKDEIVEWIINNDYKCPNCGQVQWKAYDDSELKVVAITVTPSLNRGLEDESITVEQAQQLVKDALPKPTAKLLGTTAVASRNFVVSACNSDKTEEEVLEMLTAADVRSMCAAIRAKSVSAGIATAKAFNEDDENVQS